MKKLMSILLVLAMAISMLPVYALAEDPAVVTIAFHHTDSVKDKWQNSNELKILEEQLGIKLDFQYFDTDLYALLMAGEELPIPGSFFT